MYCQLTTLPKLDKRKQWWPVAQANWKDMKWRWGDKRMVESMLPALKIICQIIWQDQVWQQCRLPWFHQVTELLSHHHAALSPRTQNHRLYRSQWEESESESLVKYAMQDYKWLGRKWHVSTIQSGSRIHYNSQVGNFVVMGVQHAEKLQLALQSF